MRMRPRRAIRRQVFLITGASSGIGLATARMAANLGASVLLVARDGAALAKITAEIRAQGGRAAYYAADVNQRHELETAAARCVAEFGPIDTWVNVAGLTIYGRLAEVDDADHRRLMETNFWGVVYGSLTAVAQMRSRGGVLINIGSIASDVSFPMQGMYCASKHAVKGFTDALRMELIAEKTPIAVVLVKPSSIDSPLPGRARNYMDREPKLPPPVYRPEVVASAILRSAVHPRREVAAGIAGPMLNLFKATAPQLFDQISPLVIALQRRADDPVKPEGALHLPADDGEARGRHPGVVFSVSAYTQAKNHPIFSIVLLGSLVLALTAGRGQKK